MGETKARKGLYHHIRMDGLIADKEINIELDAVKTVCRCVYHEYYTKKVANKSFENVAKFKFIGTKRIQN